MLERYFNPNRYLPGTWEELGEGAPTLIALAGICSRALLDGPIEPCELSLEAKTILFAARKRGIIELKAVNAAFEAQDRFLAVQVELDEQSFLVFRNRAEPEVTIRFFEGFRQLCVSGLVMHHLYRDFSLTVAGFDLAKQIKQEDVEKHLAMGTEYDVLA
jgi:hypothetical protein